MAHSGRIVEYIEHGKFVCGLVIGEDGKRLRLLNQNGREVKLPGARVLHLTAQGETAGESREEVQRQLQEVNIKRKKLADDVDLQDIWELASVEAVESFTPDFLAGLCFGEDASDDQVAAFLRAVFFDKHLFRYREGRIVVNSPEVVAQLKARAEKEKEKEEFIAKGAQLLQAIEQGGDPKDYPDKDPFLDLVRKYYLFGNDFEESAMARDLLKKAGLKGDHAPYHLLIKAGVWQKDENFPLQRFEVPVEFPDEVLEEATSYKEPDFEELLADGYQDFTDLALMTIDGELTRDFDDALHIEKKGDNFLVGIHVADVSRYVKPGRPLFTEAERRCTSLYFADRQIPMLPPDLSEGVCSLIKGHLRPVISVLTLLSPQAEIIEYKVVRGAVRVQEQLSYEKADSLIGKDEDLTHLEQLGRALRQRRIDNGALLMPIPDVLIDIGEDGNEIKVTLADADSGTRAMIAEFMVLANTLGASYVADREIPALFRSQGKPHRRLSEGFHRELYLNLRQRKYLRPALITTGPKPHSCVGAVQYTTMTSPIRRFFDLVVQQQLSGVLAGERMRFSKSDLNGYLAEITRLNSRANLVRRLRHRYWLLKFLQNDGRERVPAMVIDKGPRKVVVVLTEILLEGDLPPNQGMRVEPGDRIMVKLGKVSPLDDLLRLEW